MPPHNSISEFYGQFLGFHGGGSALTCTVNCGTSYRKVCFFLNHVQSIELATGGLQSSCRDISRMIKGNWIHLSSIWSIVAKGFGILILLAASFFWGRGCAADAMPPVTSTLELISLTSKWWWAESTHLVLIQWHGRRLNSRREASHPDRLSQHQAFRWILIDSRYFKFSFLINLLKLL